MTKENNILTENEKQANRIAALVMATTFLLFTLVYFLNMAGIFEIKPVIMNTVYIVSGLLLLSPIVLICAFGSEKRYIKFIFYKYLCLKQRQIGDHYES